MENDLTIKSLYRLIELQDEMITQLKNQLGNTDAFRFSQGSGKKMTRLEVIKYLGIHESTYKRKVKDGTLKPMRMPGGHLYYEHDLYDAYKESIRKGKA